MLSATRKANARPLRYSSAPDGSYRSIEWYGCEAELDGNRVTLTGRLHGFTSAAFWVSK